jgi:hypothetical protein
MEEKLTVMQAYEGMYPFINDYSARLGDPDTLAAMLGDLRLHKDNKPLDPAMWSDWMEAIKKIMNEDNEK